MEPRSIRSAPRPGRPKGTSTGPARELSSQEVQRLTKCTQSARDRALVWLCLGAGLRIGEAATLRLADVTDDGEGMSVLVQASNAKSGRSRRAWLVPEGAKHLRAWLAERGANSTPALFPGRGWIGLNANHAAQLVGRLIAEAGITGASSHSLRRSHANLLRRSGADLTVIQGQLGHSRLDTTARYMAPAEVERAAAVARVKF